MKTITSFLLSILLFAGMSCKSTVPKIEDGGEEYSPKQNSSKKQVANKGDGKKKSTDNKSAKVAPSASASLPLWKWNMKIARQFMSKEGMEGAQLRFEKLVESLQTKVQEIESPTKILAGLNQVVFVEADAKLVPLTSLKYPVLSSCTPYILGGRPASHTAVVVLGAALLKAVGQKKVQFAKTPDDKLLLVWSTGGKSRLLFLDEKFAYTTKKTLLKKYSYLEEDDEIYLTPMTFRQFEGYYNFLLARSSLLKRDFKSAYVYIQFGMDLYPEDPDIQNLYGVLLARNEEYVKKAIALLERAREKRPWDVDLIMTLGRLKYEVDKFEPALKEFTKARKMAPKREIIRLYLAQVLYRLKRIEMAQKELAPLLESKEKSLILASLILRGNIRLEGNDPRGVADLKRALDMNKKLPKVWGTLAQYYFQQKKYIQAKRAFQEYLGVEANAKYRKEAVKKIEMINQILKGKKAMSAQDLDSNLKHPDPEVRFEAIQALANSNHPKKLEILRSKLTDKDYRIRVHAVRYLNQQAPDKLDKLDKLIQDPHMFVRLETIMAIKQRSELKYAPLLLEAMLDKRVEVRNQAFTTLQDLAAMDERFGYNPKTDPSKKSQKKAIDKWKKWLKEEM